ncbi:GcrA family cell cycle regulator, partial [Falsiroseomonas tokyonensis]
PDGPRPPVAALRFCGEPATAGRSYCGEHYRLAYRRPGEPWDRSAPPDAPPWRRLTVLERFPIAPRPIWPAAPARRPCILTQMAA